MQGIQHVAVLLQVAVFFLHPVGGHAGQQTQLVRHAAVTVVGDLIFELARGLDPHPERRLLAIPSDVNHAFAIDHRLEARLEVAAAVEQGLRHREIAPVRQIEQLLAVVGGGRHESGRGQHLVTAGKGVDDGQKLVEIMANVQPRQPFHQRFGAGEYLRHHHGAAVGRAKHDEPPAAAFTVSVPHRLPGGGEFLDEAPRHQSAHGMGDDVAGPATGPGPYRFIELRGAIVHVLPPVVGKGLHVPLAVQRVDEGKIFRQQADGLYLIARIGGRPVGRELEAIDTAEGERDRIDPYLLLAAVGIHGGEAGTHDAVNRHHAALCRAAPAPAFLRETRIGLRPRPCLQELFLVLAHLRQQRANPGHVTGQQQALDFLQHAGSVGHGVSFQCLGDCKCLGDWSYGYRSRDRRCQAWANRKGLLRRGIIHSQIPKPREKS